MPIPTFDPNNFAGPIDNPYFTLQPGTTFITKSPDGSEVDTFVVTRETKVIDGVTCVVVRDTSKVDGELEEKTADYFAQDKDGNVWYMGEDTAEYRERQGRQHGKAPGGPASTARRPASSCWHRPHWAMQYDQETRARRGRRPCRGAQPERDGHRPLRHVRPCAADPGDLAARSRASGEEELCRRCRLSAGHRRRQRRERSNNW